MSDNLSQAIVIVAEVFRAKMNKKMMKCEQYIYEPDSTLNYLTFYPKHGEDCDMKVINHQNDWICIIIASKLMYYIF